MKKITVVVLDAYILGMEVCRELRDAGYNVIVIGEKKTMTNTALYIKGIKGQILSSPVENPKELLAELMELGNQIDGFKVLLSARESYCLWVAENAKLLSSVYKLLSPEKETIDLFTDKWEQYCLMKKLGISVPKTVILNKNGILDGEINLPAIVKPRSATISADFRKIYGCKVLALNNYEEINNACHRMLTAGFEPLIQENVPGLDENQYFFGAVSKDGKPYSICLAQKLKVDPSPNGSGMVVRTTFDQKLLEIGCQILSATNYTGICDIEFKRNWDTGELQFIEFNPRYGMGQGVMRLAGLTSPEMYVKVAVGDLSDRLNLGKPGYYWVYFDEWAKERMFPWRNCRLRKLRNKGNTCPTFKIDDCQPEIQHIINLLKLKFKRVLRLNKNANG